MTRPNIIVVTVHDLGQHLRCYGVPTVQSPNIDRLAADGCLFENSFATAPQCSPSRASLFYGRYPHQTGMLGLAQPPFSWDVHDDERHLATILSSCGYQTALIGFQHETHRPKRSGFSHLDYRWHDSCENISAATSEFIHNAPSASPFYLQVGLIEPHRHFDMYGGEPDESRGVWVPGYIEESESSREDFAGFQGAIRKMDRSVGEIIDAVDRAGIADNTLLVFTTDHGAPFPRAKCSLYDAGLKTALVARWPAGGWTGGMRLSWPVSNLDIMPTLLDFAGAMPADASFLEGVSFADLSTTRTTLFGEMTHHLYYDPMRSIRRDGHKLIANFSSAPAIHNPTQMWRPLSSPLPASAATGHHPPFELYDLRTDQDEIDNRSDDTILNELRRSMMHDLFDWMKRTNDELLECSRPTPRHRQVQEELENA